jgi:two-component system heavy metal sensor histidine kinase CusS
MAAKHWTLAGRLTRWTCAAALTPGLAVYLLGGIFLEWLATKEVEELIYEELHETGDALSEAADPVGSFSRICEELSVHHPATPLAWRLLDARSGRELGEWGVVSDFPAPTAIDATLHHGDGLFSRTEDFADGLRLQVCVDAGLSRDFVDRFWFVGGLLIAASSLVALFCSRLLSRNVSHLLEQVAADIRSSDRTSLVAREGAPDEIRSVVDELHAEMRRIREDSERARIFTTGLAHELRSPLQNLISQSEVALLRRRDVQEYETVISSQLDELMEFADAIDNLLTICASGSESRPAARERFDLGPEAELRLRRERARAVREEIDLSFSLEGDTRMSGNRESVLRGIRNVVGNALDWTPRGGRVRVGIVGESDRIVVTVEDSGPGVPEDQRERIFEAFVRGPARSGRRVGYGLGLAIARAAVVDHGGSIAVDASSLGGARFELTFPRSSHEPEAGVEAGAPLAGQIP